MNKKVILGALALIVIVAVVLTAGCVDESAEADYIVGFEDNGPYCYFDEDGNLVGFDVECMKWIAEEEGYTITFKNIEWQSTVDALNSGEVDIVCSAMSITDDRAEQMAFTEPYWGDELGIVAKAGSGKSLDDFYLGNAVIGIQKDSSSDIALKELFGNEQYNEMLDEGNIDNSYTTFAKAMEALKDGKVDLVIFDTASIAFKIEENPGEFEYVDTLDDSFEAYGVAVKLGNDELLGKLNDGFTKLMASPDWDALVQKYGLLE